MAETQSSYNTITPVSEPAAQRPQVPPGAGTTKNEQKSVAFDAEAQRAGSTPSLPHQWISKFNRKDTIIHEGTRQSRAFRHMYLLRRPSALRYFNPDDEDRPVPLEAHADRAVERKTSRDSGTSESSRREGRSTDDYIKQLNRVELFVDLVWVGIIANLSSTFGEQAFTDSGIPPGTAIGEYILLFLPIWRMWDYLREWGSDFYKDDFTQRNFIVWMLVLSVLYGINAPYAFALEDEANSLKLLIAIYLIARASFLLSYIVQAIYLPFLRRKVLYQIVTTILVSGLWIPAISVPFPGKLGLLIAANAVEQPIHYYLASPGGDNLITGGWVKVPDYEHHIERLEGFFTIVLGEGVFRLIEGSPSGLGINIRTGTVLTALILYYLLHWLYFNGDQSKEFVHALRRTWWRSNLWKTCHIILFATQLCLAASVLFLVQSVRNEKDPTEESEQTPEELDFLRSALWSASSSLSVTIAAITGMALLHRSLDKSGTLVVSNRWLRVGPRALAIVVIMCLPLFDGLSGASWCGGATTTLYVIFLWEGFAGLEKGWQFFEPKED